MEGQIWIDSASGAAILEAGRFVRALSPYCGKIEVVRDTELDQGVPRSRVTHVNIETRHAGHGELTMTEVPLTAMSHEPVPQPAPLVEN